MMIGPGRFNIYLLILLGGLSAGCKTTGDDEAAATLAIHLEVTPDAMDFSTKATIFRQNPVVVTVDKNPFLTEAQISEAKVIEKDGAFELEIQFERRGSWLLESYTTVNPGKHFAIYSQFGPKMAESRWLAAPIIRRRISNGILVFTPDASREEADQIVKGLNAVALKIKDKSKSW